MISLSETTQAALDVVKDNQVLQLLEQMSDNQDNPDYQPPTFAELFGTDDGFVVFGTYFPPDDQLAATRVDPELLKGPLKSIQTNKRRAAMIETQLKKAQAGFVSRSLKQASSVFKNSGSLKVMKQKRLAKIMETRSLFSEGLSKATASFGMYSSIDIENLLLLDSIPYPESLPPITQVNPLLTSDRHFLDPKDSVQFDFVEKLMKSQASKLTESDAALALVLNDQRLHMVSWPSLQQSLYMTSAGNKYLFAGGGSSVDAIVMFTEVNGSPNIFAATHRIDAAEDQLGKLVDSIEDDVLYSFVNLNVSQYLPRSERALDALTEIISTYEGTIHMLKYDTWLDNQEVVVPDSELGVESIADLF